MRAHSERKRAVITKNDNVTDNQKDTQEKERATGLSEPVTGLADQRSDGRAKDSLERFC